MTPVVYRADAGGNPTTLVARGAEVEIQANSPGGWFVSPLPAVELAAGNYLLGLVSGPNGEQARVYYASAANQGVWNANPYPTPTSSWGQINRSSAAWSVYVTYTPASPPPGGGSPPPAGR